VDLWITTVGGTLTTGQNLIGLYSSAGTLIASSADQTATWGGTTGLKAAALTVQGGQSMNLTPGLYWVGLLVNGTTAPVFATGNNNLSSVMANGRATASKARYATNGTATITALPTSITPSSNTLSQITTWAGLY
jgi:hypothetical protein